MITINALFDRRMNDANEGIEAGFTSKAAQKRVFEDLNSAYGIVKDRLHGAEMQECRTKGEAAGLTEWNDMWQQIGISDNFPFDLHNVRDRHVAIAEGYIEGMGEVVKMLMDLRAMVKEMPITPVVKDTKVEDFRAAVETEIKSELDRLKVSYHRALDLGRFFGGLYVSANTHWVVNEHGTEFLRTFWYLNGELTRFNVIAAAYEQLVEEGVIEPKS